MRYSDPLHKKRASLSRARLTKLFTLLPLALAVLLSGCHNDDFSDDQKAQATGEKILFTVDIALPDGYTPSRVTTDLQFKSQFEVGDQIGLFIVRHPQGESALLNPIDNYRNNIKLTYNGTSWEADEPLYHAPGGDVMDFYAYYPYDPAVTSSTIPFTVQSDQSTTQRFGASDLMMSLPALSVAKGAEVQLTFQHKMAMMQIEIPSSLLDPANLPQVTLLGWGTGTHLFLNEERTDKNSTQGDVKMLLIPDGSRLLYRALIPAQELGSGKRFCQIDYAGKIYTLNVPAPSLTLSSGKVTLYNSRLSFQ